MADNPCGDCACLPGHCQKTDALFSEPKPERCPAYGKDCDCPTGSAVRAICERTAANIHR